MIRRGELYERSTLEALQLRASLAIVEYRDALLAHPDAVELPNHQLQNGHVLVAVDAGAPIGFAALEMRDDVTAELDGLFVDPSRWGEGIGIRLVNAAANLALKEGRGMLGVVGGPSARGFYVRCGFSAMGWTSTRFGPALKMSKRL